MFLSLKASAHAGHKSVAARADFDHRAAVFGPLEFHRLGILQGTAALGDFPSWWTLANAIVAVVLAGIVTSKVKIPSLRVQLEAISPRMLV